MNVMETKDIANVNIDALFESSVVVGLSRHLKALENSIRYMRHRQFGQRR